LFLISFSLGQTIQQVARRLHFFLLNQSGCVLRKSHDRTVIDRLELAGLSQGGACAELALLQGVFDVVQLEALVGAGVPVLQLVHFVCDVFDVQCAPHHDEEEHVELKVDDDGEDEAAHALLALHHNVDQHVEVALHGTLVRGSLAIPSVHISVVADVADWQQVNHRQRH